MDKRTINLINRLNDKIRRFILHVDNRARADGACSYKIDGDNVYIKTGNMRFLICASVSDLLSKDWNEVRYTRVEYESEAGRRVMSDYFDLFGYLKEETKYYPGLQSTWEDWDCDE